MAPVTYLAIFALACCCALPTTFAETGLTDDEIVEVLRAHNYLRGMVQPVATDMERMVKLRPMRMRSSCAGLYVLRIHTARLSSILHVPSMQEWDEELAYLAQFWAGTCIAEENEYRNSQSSKYQSVGQSMAATASYTVNYTVLMQNTWFTEGRFYDYYGGVCSDEDGNQGEDLEGCENYVQVSIDSMHIHADTGQFLFAAAGVVQVLRCWMWFVQMRRIRR